MDYDHEDFIKNPAKYYEFRFAEIAADVLPFWAKGQRVYVEHRADLWNEKFRRREPLYLVAGGRNNEGALFASALTNFVL